MPHQEEYQLRRFLGFVFSFLITCAATVHCIFHSLSLPPSLLEREMALMIGLDEGLVWIKADGEDFLCICPSLSPGEPLHFSLLKADSGKQKLASISSRAYSKVQIVEEIECLVSISGKLGSVCVSDLRYFDINKKASKNFESETKMKKIKDSKGSTSFQIGEW